MSTQKYFNQAGKRVSSVTTIINSLGWNREALMRWVWSSMKEGIDPYEKRQVACDLGSYIHLCIEHFIYNAPIPEGEANKMQFEDVLIADKAVEQYKQLESDLALTCLESEIHLVSESMGFGGTPDNIYQCDTSKIIDNPAYSEVIEYLNSLGVKKPILLNDTKSSKGIWANNIIQLGAYDRLIREATNYKPDGYLIVKVNKDFDQVVNGANSVTFIPVPKALIDIGWSIFQPLIFLHNTKSGFEKQVNELSGYVPKSKSKKTEESNALSTAA